MEVTILFRDGEIIEVYHDYDKAISALVADVQRLCPERSTAGILAELEEEGSVDGYWTYESYKVKDIEEDF